jgi:hypothetical protein
MQGNVPRGEVTIVTNIVIIIIIIIITIITIIITIIITTINIIIIIIIIIIITTTIMIIIIITMQKSDHAPLQCWQRGGCRCSLPIKRRNWRCRRDVDFCLRNKTN